MFLVRFLWRVEVISVLVYSDVNFVNNNISDFGGRYLR